MAEVADIGNPEARKMYAYIFRTLADISGSWVIFKQLFTSGKENIQLLDRVASNTFGTIQRSMYESVVLGIAKLTDPAGSNAKKNLSILRLHELLQPTHPAESDGILAAWTANCQRFSAIRKKRNKQVAHADSVGTFDPPCTVSEIDDALNGVITVMRVIDKVFDPAFVAWETPIQRGDGDDLLAILNRFVCMVERMHRGQFSGPISYYQNHSSKLDEALAEIHNVPVHVIAARQGALASDPVLQVLYQVYGLTREEILNSG